MGNNRVLKDIHWLMAKVYLAWNNVGADATDIPEFKTLCERYGVNINNVDEAVEIRDNGIG